jgi:hypothetical protein
MSSADRDRPFQATADDLAPAIHETYRRLAKKEGWKLRWDVPYAELPEDIKADNREAAARIPRVIELIGLQVAPKSAPDDRTPADVLQTIEDDLERLAQAEHDGWMDVKLRNGWTRGPRNDDRKIHPSLVPYTELSEADRMKDRNAVRAYPDIVHLAGFKIVAGAKSRT